MSHGSLASRLEPTQATLALPCRAQAPVLELHRAGRKMGVMSLPGPVCKREAGNRRFLSPWVGLPSLTLMDGEEGLLPSPPLRRLWGL